VQFKRTVEKSTQYRTGSFEGIHGNKHQPTLVYKHNEIGIGTKLAAIALSEV